MPAAPIRALVVGALSRDLRPTETDGAARRGAPGGVVVHAGTALARLGAQVRVVTRLRPDDVEALLGPLIAEGVEACALPSRETTTYTNDHRHGIDHHVLRAASDPIRARDIPAAWREADLVQLGPLHPDDVPAETAAVVRGLVGLDVQGLVRAPGGGLRPSPLLPELLRHTHVVQVSERELAAVLGGETLAAFVARHGVREMLVTRAARGATVVTPAGAADVPAPPVAARAPVGAGDVFLAAYLLLRVRGRGPLEAARGAARIAARKVADGAVPRDARVEDLVG